MKMAILFTFRWRSICLTTLTKSNLTNHHHRLHPQYLCHHRLIRLVDSHIHDHHRRNSCRVPCIATLLCGTDSDWSLPSFLCTSALHELYYSLGNGRKSCHDRNPLIISIVQPYPRGDGKTGLGTQSLFQTINW